MMTKRLLLTLVICFAALPAAMSQTTLDYAPYPEPGTGYVTDIAGVLSDEEEEQIETWFWQMESKTGVEMAVVTINSISDYPGTNNRSIEQFAMGLFNAYGIGNMPKNDGVLLLVAVKDRKARIELGGHYGFNRDGATTRIMQHKIIPHFQTGHYNKGILAGSKALMREFAGLRPLSFMDWVIACAIVVILMFVATSLWVDGKRGWAWVVIGFLIAFIILLLRVGIEIAEHMPEGDSSGWSSGGFGGGFGGGFSGGGGATGSW